MDQGQWPGGKAQARFATLFLPLSFHEVLPASSSHSSWAVCYLPSARHTHLPDMSYTGCPPHPKPAHHLSMFLAHVKTHEQGPYNHHDDKDHHHDHDEKALEVHRAAGDAEPAPGGC